MPPCTWMHVLRVGHGRLGGQQPRPGRGPLGSPTLGLVDGHRRGVDGGRAVSARTSMSAHRCFTAWNDPMGLPNCSALFGVGDGQLHVARGQPTQQRPRYSTRDQASHCGDRCRVAHDRGGARRPGQHREWGQRVEGRSTERADDATTARSAPAVTARGCRVPAP